MGFSRAIREQALVLAARRCFVCRRLNGVGVEVHHITPLAQGGESTLDNAIVLCFDCHRAAGHYNQQLYTSRMLGWLRIIPDQDELDK